jgi:hydrogenase maturation protease
LTVRTLVVGLGNTIRGDDAVGVLAARELRQRLDARDDVEVKELESSADALLDVLGQYDEVIVVDAVTGTGEAAGTVRWIEVDRLGASPAISSHRIGLPTVAELGRRLGLTRPGQILACAIAIEPADEFGTGISAAARLGVRRATCLVERHLRSRRRRAERRGRVEAEGAVR